MTSTATIDRIEELRTIVFDRYDSFLWATESLRLDVAERPFHRPLAIVDRVWRSMRCSECGVFIPAHTWTCIPCVVRTAKPTDKYPETVTDDMLRARIAKLRQDIREYEIQGEYDSYEYVQIERIEEELDHREWYRDFMERHKENP